MPHEIKTKKNNIMVIYLLVSAFLTIVFVCLRYPSYVNDLSSLSRLLSEAQTLGRSNDDNRMEADIQKQLDNQLQQNYQKCVRRTKLFFWLSLLIVFIVLFGINIWLQPELVWNNALFYGELVFVCGLAIFDICCCFSHYRASVTLVRNDFAFKLFAIISLVICLGILFGILV